MKKVLIINGVNLDQLGKREPEIYGTLDLFEYESALRKEFPEVELVFFQSNLEGEIVSRINEESDILGIVINPGAYTHSSVAIADAIRITEVPTIEVHISAVFGRKPYRKKSYIAEVCMASISGLGIDGYAAAIRKLTK